MANPLIPPAQRNPMQPPIDTIPTPVNSMIPPVPMPPPPPLGTGLGFQQWASQPMNALKIQPSMTSPTTPLQPGARPSSMFTAQPSPRGLLSPGNININDRPIVPNPQAGRGQSSTVWSTSFGTDKGETLVPRVSDGEDGQAPRILSQNGAQQYYKRYGKNLGVFDNPDDADAYAEALHQQQAGLGAKNGRTFNPNPPVPSWLDKTPPPTQPPLNMGSSPLALPQPTMAAVNPPKPKPMASVMPPQMPPKPNWMIPPGQAQLDTDTQKLRDLQTQGAGLNKIQNPFLRGLARAGDIVAPFLIGGGAAAIPGTTLHNRYEQRQQAGVVAGDQSQMQAAAQLADTQSQTAQRNATADATQAKTDFYSGAPLTAAQAASIGHPELEGETMSQKVYSSMLTGKQKTDSAETIQGGKNDTATTVAAGKNQTAKEIADARNARIQAVTDAANKTRLLLQDKKDSTSSANTAARINAKGAPGAPGGGKVPADVTKRAALASNVLENADATRQLIQKRPDIVGAGGGRYTSVQQMIGSNDPDIVELGVRMHNIALASNGAHGLRSAEAVAQTENELFNHFKTGPQGINAGLNAMTGSVQTFLDDEKNFQTTGSRTGQLGARPNNLVPPTKLGGTPQPPAGSQAFTDGGVTYHIPANQVAAFKKDHPNAR